MEEKDFVLAFCSNDKSKIHDKESDAPLKAGVRGCESITLQSRLVSHKPSLSLNVALRCDILTSTDKSFVRRNVYYTVSDSVF